MTQIDRAHPALRAAALATEPSAAAVARVKGRILAGLLPTTDLLHLPEGDPHLLAAEVRVRARLSRPVRARRPAWVVAGPPLLAAAAVLAVVASPDLTPVHGSHRLEVGTPSPLSPSPHVQLTHRGQGTVEGAGDTWAIDWEAGALHAEVTPGQGVDLVVTTREATIRVVGTGFDVERDRLGTTVTVQHGKVSVDCVDTVSGTGVLLVAGERHTCAPDTGAGLLGRALALSEGAGTAEGVLEALDRGLTRNDATGAIRQELLAARIAPLAALGAHGEALAAAEAYLVDGGAREDEIRRYAARAALGLHGCDRAAAHLEALRDPTADETAARDACRRE